MFLVILDSNALHKEGYVSHDMLRLGRLVSESKAKIILPTLVKREYLSKRQCDFLEHIKKSKSGLESAKRFSANEELNGELVAAEKLIDILTSKVSSQLEKDFDDWFVKNNGELIDFELSCVSDVFNDYFSGLGAFKSVKNRSDIPDSFIGKCIELFAFEKTNVNVIVQDKVFSKHLATLANVKTFNELGDFLKDESVVQTLDELDSLQDGIQAFKNLIYTQGFLVNLNAYLKEGIGLGSIYIESDEIPGSEKLGIDFFGMSINGVVDDNFYDRESQINFGDVSYISDGVFSLAVSLEAAASLSYCVEYYDYQSLPLARKKSLEITSMNGDGICDVSELVLVTLTGFVEFKSRDEIVTKDSIASIADHFSLVLNAFEIDLEIDAAEILEC
ncbi:PIN domain-containing protein [Deefgea rivuli]|uniref:PIN domain-containing protein n=1 Tax=Deefgea rivuli TaxID=400948 RepID=UPI000480F202|nr:PIN domain-containing protein [Deefgea rivuli]